MIVPTYNVLIRNIHFMKDIISDTYFYKKYQIFAILSQVE